MQFASDGILHQNFFPAPLISRLLFLLLWALWSFVYVSIKIHVISARWKQNSTLRPPFCVVSAKLLLWTLLVYRQSFPILIFALFCQQFPYNRCNFLQKKGERSTSCTSAKTASFRNCPWFPNMYSVYHLQRIYMQ